MSMNNAFFHLLVRPAVLAHRRAFRLWCDAAMTMHATRTMFHFSFRSQDQYSLKCLLCILGQFCCIRDIVCVVAFLFVTYCVGIPLLYSCSCMRKHTTCLHTWCPTVNASCRVVYKCIWANFHCSLPTLNLRFWTRQNHAPILPMTFTDSCTSMHVKGWRNKYIRGVETKRLQTRAPVLLVAASLAPRQTGRRYSCHL